MSRIYGDRLTLVVVSIVGLICLIHLDAQSQQSGLQDRTETATSNPPVPQGEDSDADPVLLQRIDQLIDQLGAAKFKTREKATRLLWEAGRNSEPRLQAKLKTLLKQKNANREIIERIKAVLADFDYGIYPETKSAIKTTILSFRDGNPGQKRMAGQKLLASGEVSTLIKLILKEPDPKQIESFVNELFGSGRFVRQLIEKGDISRAIESLRLLVLADEQLPLSSSRRRNLATQYIWLTLVNDQVETEIANVGNADSANPNTVLDLQIRFNFLKGQFDQAVETSRGLIPQEAADQKLEELLIASQNWNQLSDQYWDPDRPAVSELEVRKLIVALSCHRLSGKKDRFEVDLNKLYTFSDPFIKELSTSLESGWFDRANSATARMIIGFLLCNGHPEKAMTYLKQIDRFRAFNTFVAMDDYGAAFAVLGYDSLSRETAVKFEESLKGFRPSQWHKAIEEIEKLTNVIQAFYNLGFFDEAKKLYRQIYSIAARYEEEQVGSIGVVCMSMLEENQKELFFELIESELQKQNYQTALSCLFDRPVGRGDQIALANYWWSLFEKEFPDKTPLDRLKLLDQFLKPLRPDQQPKPEFVSLLAKAAVPLEKSSGSWGDEAYIGQTYLLWNDRDNSKRWFSKFDFSSIPSSDVAFELGDLHYEDGEFDLAAEAYLKAWKYGQQRVDGLLLSGIALDQTQQKILASKRIQLARQLLFSASEQQVAISALLDRKLNSYALPLIEDSLKTNELLGSEIGTSRFRFADAGPVNQNQRAADLIETQLLSMYSQPTYNLSEVFYTFYAINARLQTFDAFVADNRAANAYEVAKQALALRPCSATLAEEHLPQLGKIDGGSALADELFETIRAEYKQKLTKFPNSGLFRNNLAWINTTNGKYLNEALENAELAVKNEPNNPTYMDTLADVCFNLGRKERAIQLMKQCLSFDPGSEHYQNQLARFQGKKTPDNDNE